MEAPKVPEKPKTVDMGKSHQQQQFEKQHSMNASNYAKATNCSGK